MQDFSITLGLDRCSFPSGSFRVWRNPGVPIEKIKDIRELLEGGSNVSPTLHLNVLVVHPELLHSGHPDTGGANKPVLVPLDNNDRQVTDFRQVPYVARRSRSHRGQGRPDIRVLHAKMPGATSTHGMSHQVNAVIIDIEFPANDPQHVHHVLLAQFTKVPWNAVPGALSLAAIPAT